MLFGTCLEKLHTKVMHTYNIVGKLFNHGYILLPSLKVQQCNNCTTIKHFVVEISAKHLSSLCNLAHLYHAYNNCVPVLKVYP